MPKVAEPAPQLAAPAVPSPPPVAPAPARPRPAREAPRFEVVSEEPPAGSERPAAAERVAPVRETAPKPAPSRPAPPAPRAVAAAPPPPEVEVLRTSWHPRPERRTARVRVSGLAAPVEIHEGDAVATLVVKTIEPSGVLFLNGGQELKRGVGER